MKNNLKDFEIEINVFLRRRYHENNFKNSLKKIAKTTILKNIEIKVSKYNNFLIYFTLALFGSLFGFFINIWLFMLGIVITVTLAVMTDNVLPDLLERIVIMEEMKDFFLKEYPLEVKSFYEEKPINLNLPLIDSKPTKIPDEIPVSRQKETNNFSKQTPLQIQHQALDRLYDWLISKNITGISIGEIDSSSFTEYPLGHYIFYYDYQKNLNFFKIPLLVWYTEQNIPFLKFDQAYFDFAVTETYVVEYKAIKSSAPRLFFQSDKELASSAMKFVTKKQLEKPTTLSKTLFYEFIFLNYQKYEKLFSNWQLCKIKFILPNPDTHQGYSHLIKQPSFASIQANYPNNDPPWMGNINISSFSLVFNTLGMLEMEKTRKKTVSKSSDQDGTSIKVKIQVKEQKVKPIDNEDDLSIESNLALSEKFNDLDDAFAWVTLSQKDRENANDKSLYPERDDIENYDLGNDFYGLGGDGWADRLSDFTSVTSSLTYKEALEDDAYMKGLEMNYNLRTQILPLVYLLQNEKPHPSMFKYFKNFCFPKLETPKDHEKYLSKLEDNLDGRLGFLIYLVALYPQEIFNNELQLPSLFDDLPQE
jgi:hypothetical protein